MRRMFGSSSAMRTIGTYVVRSRAGVPVGALWRASDADFPSERSFVVNLCPSEIRSTSSATESIACSIRSSLAATSLGIWGFFDWESIRLEYDLTKGTPMTRMIAVAKKPSGTTISGPISKLPENYSVRSHIKTPGELLCAVPYQDFLSASTPSAGIVS